MLHLPEFVRCVEIERGPGPVYQFGNALRPSLLDEVVFRFHDESFPRYGQEITAREALGWLNTQGLIVVRQGCVVCEEYPGMDPAQRHHWMSIAKAALNMLTGMLVSSGALDLTRRVDYYVPALRACGYGDFTLQEVADMDADVTMNEDDYNDPLSPFWEWGRAVGWFAAPEERPGGVKELLRSIDRLPRRTGTAAEEVRYSGSSSQVLAWAIEEVLGLSMAECFQRHLWQRLGAASNALASVDAQGVVFVGGGYASTLRDLARFGSIWATQGVAPDGTRVFAEEWLAECTSGRGLRIAKDCIYHNQAYGRNGWICHQGHSGQMLLVDPGTQTVFAGFASGQRPNGLEKWTMRLQMAICEAILQHLEA